MTRYFRDLRLPVGAKALLALGPCILSIDGFREPCTKFLYCIFLGQSRELRAKRFIITASKILHHTLQGRFRDREKGRVYQNCYHYYKCFRAPSRPQGSGLVC